MADILLACRDCGKEHGHSESREGCCPACYATRRCQSLRTDYTRLWLKRMRYYNAGHDLQGYKAGRPNWQRKGTGIDEQIRRTAFRIQREVMRWVPRAQAEAVWQQQLQMAVAATEPTSRLAKVEPLVEVAPHMGYTDLVAAKVDSHVVDPSKLLLSPHAVAAARSGARQ